MHAGTNRYFSLYSFTCLLLQRYSFSVNIACYSLSKCYVSLSMRICRRVLSRVYRFYKKVGFILLESVIDFVYSISF